MNKDILFLLAAPFEDAGQQWYCPECATMEGALLVNPHWLENVEVRRVSFPRPRADVIALIGEEHQGLPVLVLREGAAIPFAGRTHNGRVFIKQAVHIGTYLANTYGGARPHL